MYDQIGMESPGLWGFIIVGGQCKKTEITIN